MDFPSTVPTVVFCLFATPPEEREAILLVESLRTFGGALADAPVRIYVSRAFGGISAAARSCFFELEAEILHIEADARLGRNLRAQRLFAASRAEAFLAAQGKPAKGQGSTRTQANSPSTLLAWLDPDSFFAGSPEAFGLAKGKDLAYRPVHHRLIGSSFDSPPDEFWARLYAMAGVSEGQVFPMETTMDRERIRPYFNAGLLVVRPERGLFASWLELYFESLGDSALARLCEDDPRRSIFLHQAVLAAAILSSFSAGTAVELPFSYNYPLHLHSICPEALKPGRLEDLVSLRYDDWGRWPGSPSWRDLLAMGGDRAAWFEGRTRALAAGVFD